MALALAWRITMHTCPSGVASLLVGITPMFLETLSFSAFAGSLSLGSLTLWWLDCPSEPRN